MTNHITLPGPLLKLACERLLKLLVLLDAVSVTQGEEQVIRFRTDLGDAVFRVQIERGQQRYTTIAEEGRQT